MPEKSIPLSRYPAPVGRTLASLLTAFISGCALVTFCTGTSTVPLTGTLQAERQLYVVPQDCRVVSSFVKPGDQLTPGMPLVKLSAPEWDALLQQNKEQQLILSAQLAQAQSRAEMELAWRIRTVDEEIQQRHERITALTERRFIHHIQEINFTSPTEKPASQPAENIKDVTSAEKLHPLVTEEESRHTEARLTEITLCRQQVKQLLEIKDQLPETVRKSSGVDVIQSQLSQLEQETQSLTEKLDGLSITSKGYGTVSRWISSGQEFLPAGTTLLETHDLRKQFLELPVPSRNLPDYQTGTEVILHFPGNEMRMGKITSVALQSTTRRQFTPTEDATINVRVTPVGKLWPQLPLGTKVEVSRKG